MLLGKTAFFVSLDILKSLSFSALYRSIRSCHCADFHTMEDVDRSDKTLGEGSDEAFALGKASGEGSDEALGVR